MTLISVSNMQHTRAYILRTLRVPAPHPTLCSTSPRSPSCLLKKPGENVSGTWLPNALSLAKDIDSAHRHFTPAWHTVIMGTGVTSALIHNFPYGHGSPVIRIFTLIIFFLNLVLFVLISVATALRYALFPDVWSKMLRHPAQSLFVGAVPMGITTLINIALVCNTTIWAGSRLNLLFRT